MKSTLTAICVTTALLILLPVSWINGESLIQNSPFLPPDYKKAAKTPEKRSSQEGSEPTRFALKGVSKLGSEYYFSIYDSVAKKSEWIQAGVPHNGFSILKYEPSERRIHFSWEGKSSAIQIPKADGEPIQLVYLDSHGTAEAPDQFAEKHNSHSRESHKGQYSIHNDRYNVSIDQYDSDQNEPVIFTQRIQQAFSSGTQLLGNKSILFATTDTKALAEIAQEFPSTPERRYQVSRRNSVHNPSGKKPEHMSFAQWQALSIQ